MHVNVIDYNDMQHLLNEFLMEYTKLSIIRSILLTLAEEKKKKKKT